MAERIVETVGILGAGQLGRMLAVAASRLGLRTHVYAPDPDPIAAQVANAMTSAPYEDATALSEFADAVDVVTYEFENVPAEALDQLESARKLLPRRNALTISQDRLLEKDFLNDAGLTTAPYANVETESDAAEAATKVGSPSIMKTRRLGYDGKGQVRLDRPEDAAPAWTELGNVPCIVEGFVDYRCEISVIAARSLRGEVVCFEPGENVHRDGILRTTTIPAAISEAERAEALSAASTILQRLDYVGVMGIELFVTADGLAVNEIAPRVHNSGHWTQNGCAVDQFEQHIRCVAGWPLGDGGRHSNVEMTNLIGDDVLNLPELARDPALALHVYGKADVRPGRKMGHVNRITGPAGSL
ncbi:MAG TPA: 5-(carboxyamino)imidazole ribonucleotide synthase [Actinomycetota bacterium]|nr:5-(carboxyamino)imidazole ribonucleotide synthase [Actinomycetota bacterium]